MRRANSSLVPGELGEDQRVERALAADARVAVHGVRAGRVRAARLEHAREELEREVHDVVRGGARDRREQIDVRERAGGGRLGAEHAEEAQRVEVERVGEREHVEARARERVERGGLEGARTRGEELRELPVEVAHELRDRAGSSRRTAGLAARAARPSRARARGRRRRDRPRVASTARARSPRSARSRRRCARYVLWSSSRRGCSSSVASAPARDAERRAAPAAPRRAGRGRAPRRAAGARPSRARSRYQRSARTIIIGDARAHRRQEQPAERTRNDDVAALRLRDRHFD